MEHLVEDLTGKSFRIISHYGKDGILQSTLWKELEITSRDGSRLALKLEKQSLIKREKILEKGRWTYKLFPVKLPVDTESIDKAPCLMCPVEHMCSEDGSYSPNNCNLIQGWILSALDSLRRPQYLAEQHQDKQEIPELSSKHTKLPRKSTPRRALKNSKK